MLAQNAALALAFAPLRLSVSAKKANQSFINQKTTEAPFEEPLLFYTHPETAWPMIKCRFPPPKVPLYAT
jgi:Zn-dependent protease with chaperone function